MKIEVGRMDVPRPSDAFCSLVERELAEARERAEDILKEVVPVSNNPPKIDDDYVRVIHERVLAGEPLAKIADVIWDSLGYRNSNSCRTAINARFRALGLRDYPTYTPRTQPSKQLVTLESDKQVDHPDHYGGDTPYEVIKVLEAWYPDGIPFEEGNAIKYIARAKHKESEKQDLMKAVWYLMRRIEKLNANQH